MNLFINFSYIIFGSYIFTPSALPQFPQLSCRIHILSLFYPLSKTKTKKQKNQNKHASITHTKNPQNTKSMKFVFVVVCLFGLPTFVHDTSLEDSLFSSSQQLLITNSFLVEDDILCPLIISLLGFLHILKYGSFCFQFFIDF